MKGLIRIVTIPALAVCLASALYAQEPEEGGSEPSFMDILKEAASEAVGEQIGELTGETRGDITDVKLVERRGNALILDVRYKDVKRHRDVFIKAEVLYGGAPLEGFANTIAQVTDRKGTARLTVRRDASAASDDEWGISESSGEESSDQLRLYLVRESNPDTPFGVLIFDLYKVWTDDDAPEVEEEEAVALAEGESSEGAAPKPRPVYVPSGTTLKPVAPAAVAKPATVKPATSAAAQAPAASRSSATLARPMAATAKPTVIGAGERFDLYSFASKANWKSGAGMLPFPGKQSDARGFAQTRGDGALSPKNTKAKKLLLTHPQRVDNGWIEGAFPLLKLPAKASFETVLGILYGASSEGAKVSVFVQEPGKAKRRIFRKNVTPQRYEKVKVNLARWAGKNVTLIFRVDAAGSSRSDFVVWVAPRITSER